MDMNLEAINNIPFMFVVLAVVVLIFVCIGLLFIQLKQLYRDQGRNESVHQSLQIALDKIKEELLEGHESRKLIEVQLKTVRARQRQIDLREPQAIPYNHAITMVKRGAEARDLISSCGLSQGEAELIIAIHGNNQ
jgi:hypothetical protein